MIARSPKSRSSSVAIRRSAHIASAMADSTPVNIIASTVFTSFSLHNGGGSSTHPLFRCPALCLLVRQAGLDTLADILAGPHLVGGADGVFQHLDARAVKQGCRAADGQPNINLATGRVNHHVCLDGGIDRLCLDTLQLRKQGRHNTGLLWPGERLT